MLINRPPDIPSSEISDESLFWNRRAFLQAAGLGAAAAGGLLPLGGRRLFGSDAEKLTPWEDVTGYNNYCEFGTGKDDPARDPRGDPAAPLSPLAGLLRTLRALAMT